MLLHVLEEPLPTVSLYLARSHLQRQSNERVLVSRVYNTVCTVLREATITNVFIGTAALITTSSIRSSIVTIVYRTTKVTTDPLRRYRRCTAPIYTTSKLYESSR